METRLIKIFLLKLVLFLKLGQCLQEAAIPCLLINKILRMLVEIIRICVWELVVPLPVNQHQQNYRRSRISSKYQLEIPTHCFWTQVVKFGAVEIKGWEDWALVQ